MNHAIDETFDREAPEFHEAGHAIITVSLGGIINHEGVEIADRWHCGSRFFPLRNDSPTREPLTCSTQWRAGVPSISIMARAKCATDKTMPRHLEYVLECLRSRDDEECEELGDDGS